MMMFNVRKRVFDLNRHKGTKKIKKNREKVCQLKICSYICRPKRQKQRLRITFPNSSVG